jgi:DNA-binding transcriptional LysR family regulator
VDTLGLRRLDLNLVVALHELLQERNVSAAARRLGVSQSATSQSLAKLRRHFDDELLTRVDGRYELTPLATRLHPRVAALARDLAAVLTAPDHFDPATSRHQFVVTMSDAAALVFGAPLVRALAERAPSCTLRIQDAPPPGLRSIRDTLRTIDGIVLPRAMTPPGDSLALYTDSWACVVDSSLASEAASWDQDAFEARSWVATGMHGGAPAQEFLRRAGVEIDVVVTTPGFSAVPYVVAGTAMVGVLHRRPAETLAAPSGTVVVPTPWVEPEVHMVLFHDPERSLDPTARWFLDLAAEVSQSLAPS